MDLVIANIFEWIFDKIDEIDSSILKGVAIIFTFLAILAIILWLINNIFIGSWKTTATVLGIWAFAELANWLGGGWN